MVNSKHIDNITNITNIKNKIFTQNNLYLITGLLTIFIALWTILYAIPSLFITIFNTILGNLILVLIIILSAKFNVVLSIGLAITFLIIYQFSHMSSSLKEGFGLPSLTSASSASLISTTADKYANLAPLPADNIWSKATADAFTAKLKSLYPTVITTDAQMAENISRMQKNASDAEASAFASTGLWPWDDFIMQGVTQVFTDAFTNDPNNKDKTDADKQEFVTNKIKQYQGMLPNRSVFAAMGPQFDSVKSTPQGQLLADLQSPNGYDAGNKTFINCMGTTLMLYKPSAAGERTQYTMSADSAPQQYPGVETNYSILPKLISGFKFVNDSCNICDSSKPCAFSMNGTISSPWDIYWGTKPVGSVTESAPATVTSQQSADPSKFPELNKIKTELNTLFPTSSSSSS